MQRLWRWQEGPLRGQKVSVVAFVSVVYKVPFVSVVAVVAVVSLIDGFGSLRLRLKIIVNKESNRVCGYSIVIEYAKNLRRICQ